VEATRWRTTRWPKLHISRDGVACLLLAVIFARAALAKLSGLHEIESTLMAARLVPVSLTRLAAISLIVVELATAGCLMAPRLRASGLQLTALLLCLFIGYSAWRWWQNIPIPCHCFGALFKMAPWAALLLNFGLLGLTISLLARADAPARRGRSAA
jgi:hypothetical protein